MTNELRELWDQQPGETNVAYYLFCLYRDLPLFERSAVRVRSDAMQINPTTGEPGKTRGLRQIEKYRSRWFWVERARAYDRSEDEKRRRKHTEATLVMAERQAQHAHAYQEALFMPVRLLLERMRDPIQQIEFSQLPTQDLIQLSLLTARLFPQVARAEREARGAPLPDLSAVYDEATGEIKTSDIDAIEAYDWYRSMAAALEVAGVTRRQIAPPDEEAKP